VPLERTEKDKKGQKRSARKKVGASVRHVTGFVDLDGGDGGSGVLSLLIPLLDGIRDVL
jgi:hypothetical protein